MKKIRVALWVFVVILAVGFIALNLPQKTDDNGIATPIAGFNQGTHFTLTDYNNAAFNSDEKISDGHYGLLFFGFTHCPVICPTELQKFAVVMDDLPLAISDKITPIFITIDPERDTVEAMKNYVPQFHEKIIGLTGNVDDIHAVLNDWKVFYTKVDDPAFTEYTMDHSTYSYLVDHDMRILGLYRLKNTAVQIADNIEQTVQ